MVMKKNILFIILISLLVSANVYATHIVGGSLTYVHNGGSNYTITLKLYRDCAPGTAGFPNSVTISVLGFNGAAFSPSKNIVIPRGTVTNVPPVLDPCAVAPNPMPCVQEAIYSMTVNNLPPNPGGYHLYYQLIARNLTVMNVAGANCNCVGESFYAYIPGNDDTWFEDFTFPNGTTVDNGATAWSNTVGATPPNRADVRNNLFEVRGANNATNTWESEVINIAAFPTGVSMSVNLFENGTFEAQDTIFTYYRLNGGPLIPFSTNGFINNDFNNAIASQTPVIGTTVQIVIQTKFNNNSPNTEIYRFDNVAVFGNNFISNSNPEFDLFPPLFLCVNQPFTFNHAATDIDGDSLFYTFYNPYNGDNGAGPLDPTFVNNVAIFTPINWVAGFSTTNPLGGTPLVLNPTTGLLNGTPTMLGQYVVGVKVLEYRNGVFLSETLRDFQFNVINCPQPTPPVAGTDLVLNDGCVSSLSASGFVPSTVTWTSIFPGPQGTYDNFLSCTAACLNPTVTPSGTPPPFVDYMICGTASACNAAFTCDTVRVTFNPPLSVSITPINPTICFGQTSTTLTATGSGGTPPYSYLWNNVNPSQTNIVGAGTFTVMLSDTSGCPPVFATVTVTQFTNPIAVNAGADLTVCNQSPTTTLNATVTGASGGIWSGGNGTFSPNDSTLSGVTYTPTATELTNGFVDLFLTSTGNGTCPLDVDTIRINYVGFTGTPLITSTNVTCFGANDGTGTVAITGGFAPHTYGWNAVPLQTTATATGLAPGSYIVTTQDNIGCTRTDSILITEPLPLVLGDIITNVSCPGGNDGSITVNATGGTAPYSYLFTPGGQTTQTITSQLVGNYSVTVTDANGCTQILASTIAEPQPIVITFASTNVLCAGGSDGSATATVTGGTAPYSYNWTPSGGTAATATGLIAGNYTLTVTDNNACIATNNITITEPTPITATINSVNVTCNGLSDGTATVTTNGGTAPYSFQWNPVGGTTATATNLAAGNYSVTITDANGCVFTQFTTITEPQPLTLATNQTNVSCFGGNDGTGSVLTSGGTAPFTYFWNPGAFSTPTATNLAANTYAITVSDANGCQAQTNITITQPSVLAGTTTSTPVSCPNGNDGTLTANPSGGTAPYTYFWLPNGQTTATISGQPAGNYSVTITDANGCVITLNNVITEPNPIVISFNTTNVSCFNGSDGSATANVVGGTAPYTYSWSPLGGTNQIATGLPIGNYTATITDNNGCIATNTIAITQPTPLVGTFTSTNETCTNANDGSTTMLATGGTAPYTYAWSPVGGTNATATGLAAGNYTGTITDNLGCQTTVAVTITEPPLLVLSTIQTNVSCFGGNNGNATVTPTGGTPNYTYAWLPSGSTSNLATNLAVGTHTVTVTDNNGCQEQIQVNITEPLILNATLTPTPPTCFGGNDGSATATITGGTAPYSYLWMPGNITTQTATNLVAGTYTFTVTDANGCIFTNTVTINNPPQLVLNSGAINSTCGLANGLAFVSIASGGTAPFTYLWSPVGGTNDTASGLFAGVYTVIVTDANGCTASATGNVNDLAAPVISFASSTNVSCFGGNDGSASVSLVGGLGPFTYLWSPSGNTTPNPTGLSAGTHSVLVTGSNGCSSSASIVITEPSAISANVTTTPVSCFGGNDGTATITAFGGTPAYTFNWLTVGTTGSTATNLIAGLDSVRVTDANGCQLVVNYTITQPIAPVSAVLSSTPVSCFGGSNGTVTAIAAGGTAPYTYLWNPGSLNGATQSNLSAGNYTVTITDNNNCVFNSGNVTVTEPTIINLTTTTVNANCGQADGQATVVATGGTAGYSYTWSPFGGNNATATSLFAGNYTVTVTDANGCIMQASVTINDTPPPTATITGTTNVSCFGGNNGTATVVAAGGTAPYAYLWSPIGGTNTTATNLTAGTFSVVVTDANGCQSIPAITPQITQPTLVVASFTITNVSCFGGNDGSATANPVGGVAPYTYFWFTSGSTNQTATNLSAGLDSLRITDANGCVAVVSFTINQPALLTSAITNSTNVSCFGGANGSATVTATGGTPNYAYQWLPFGGTSNTAIGLSAGNYTVNITDNKGCTTTSNITINEPVQQLATTIATTPNSCFGGNNGIATANPTGGTPGYTYQWLPIGGTNQATTGLPIGNYTVTVTDANGCSTNASVNITQPPALTGNLAVVDPSCGLPNGTITAQISGGTPIYNYAWTPGSQTTPNLSGLAAGNYALQVTDANGCVLNLATTLNPIPTPTVAITNSTNVACFNGNNGTATALANSGVAPYSYSWTPVGGNNATATGLSAGNYTVTVTDVLGCTATDNVLITQPTALALSTSAVSPVSCNGGNDGQITVTANGGMPNYTYSWNPVLPTLPTVSNLAAGTYAATVTDQNNCSTSISVVITEPATLISSVGATTDPLCSTSIDGTATVTASGGTLPYSYLWSNGQTGATAVSLTGGNYSVTVTDANGCTSITNVVLNQPSPVVTIAGIDDTICAGQQGVVTATASGGVGNYSFGWQPVGATNSGTLNVNPIINTTYTVVAFDQNGCPGNVDTVSVHVYDFKQADFSISASSTLICPGQIVELAAQSNSTTVGAITFTWNNGLGTGAGPFFVSPTQPTTYIVTATNECGTALMDSIRVNFSPNPTISFVSNNDSLCFPAAVEFVNTSVTGNPDDQIHFWLWDFGDGTTSGVQNPIHTYSAPGSYTVTLTATTGNGCVASSTLPTNIQIFPSPTAAFTVNSTLFYLPTEQLVTTNLSTGATSYNWNFGDGGTSTAFSPTYLYNLIGNFTITLTATNQFGCSDVAAIDITTNADVVFPNAFTPNPGGPSGGFYDVTDLSNDIFFPYTSGVVEFEFEIFNRWGELIFATKDIKQGWDGYYKGELAQQGVYIWKAYLKLNNGREVNKTGDVTLLR